MVDFHNAVARENRPNHKEIYMITKLIKYQEIDKKLKDIENMLGASDERKHVFLSAKFLKSVPELVAKIDNKAVDLMNQLSQIKDKREKLSEQLQYISSDVDNIETEESVHYTMKKADEIIASIKVLDTACAKLSNEMASLSAEYDQVKAKTAKANAQYKEYNEKYTALKASVQDEMKKIQTELAELRKSIDADKMKKYDEKRKDKFPVLVPLKGNRCGGCGMELSMKSLADLELGEVVECDNCRTIVYNQK